MGTRLLLLGFLRRFYIWWVAVLLAVCSPAFGYQQTVSKNYGIPISQPTTAITMYVNMGCPTEAKCWDKIARSAIAEWNAVNAPFYIRAVVGAANIPTACADVDDRNTLQWSATKCQGEAWGEAAGYAWMYISRRGDILESDVRLRRTPPPGQTWTTAWFRHVVLHELGHVVGLDHPDEHGQEVSAVMNHSGAWTDYLQLDDRNGIRGIYGAQLWDDTPYPTELLGAWRMRHPETGQTFRWTASHFRWIGGVPSVSFRAGALVGIGARATAAWPDWEELETHIIRLHSDTECTDLAGLYEGANRFTGWLFVGTHKDADGFCTQWPASRQYPVEWWREPAP